MRAAKDLTNRLLKFLNKHDLAVALIVTAALIVVGVGFGWYNNRLVLPTTNPIARYTLEPSNPLSFMSNWDGPDYINLALHGYQAVSLASFFPLYPLLIHIFHEFIGSALYSALLISWVSLVGAVYYYLKILKRLFPIKDNMTALKGLVFLVLFPTSVFLIATYTESLFALLSLAAIYYAFNKRYLLSSLFILFGCLTHLDGIFVLILVCLILLEEKVHFIKVAATFIIGLLGLGGYSLYLYEKFNSPLAFVLSQKSHGWLNHHYSELFQSVGFFNAVFICLLVLAIIYWWRKRRSFSYYSFLFLLIPIIGNQFGGFNRYMLIAFPVQFMAYDIFKKRNFSYALLLALMGIVWTYFTFQYAGGYIGG